MFPYPAFLWISDTTHEQKEKTPPLSPICDNQGSHFPSKKHPLLRKKTFFQMENIKIDTFSRFHAKIYSKDGIFPK